MANKLKARLAAGKACVNAWLAIPSGFSAEVMARVRLGQRHRRHAARRAGLPVHGAVLPGDGPLPDHAAGARAVERTRHHRQGAGRRRLGHHLPDGEHHGRGAKALADACLYPPIGKRSNGPIRAAMYGEASSYQTIANDEVLVIAMIETQDGIDNIDEILSRARHQRHLYRPVRHGLLARPDRRSWTARNR